MEDESAEWKVPSTSWVKGELLSDLSPATIDPRGLLSAGPGRHLFDRLSWFDRVARHDAITSPLIVHAWDKGLHGWLFLNFRSDRTAIALANWYSLAIRPIFDHDEGESRHRTLLGAMARRLRQMNRAPHQIVLAPVPRADGNSDLILSAFGGNGWIALRRQSSTNWTANVAGRSFADYWAGRPGQVRNTFERKLKKYDVKTEILTRFDQAAWADYESVYADSWKQPEGSMAFLKDLATEEGARGNLRLGLARIGDEVVAAQFWTVENGTAIIHKLAHREAFKEQSPGTILSVALFRHVIDQDKVSLIDFGTGNDAYKRHWMDDAAPLDTIMLFNKRTIRGWWAAGKTWASALVRRKRFD